MDLSSLLPPMKTCQNLDWLSFLFSFSMNFYSKVKHELNHSLCHFKPVNALLPVAGTGNTMLIKLLICIYLLNYFSYWNSFNGHMTKFLSIMKQQEGEARWVSPRLARLPRYLEGVLMSSHMDDFFGWADFHHINLTLKVSSHCTRISPEIRFPGTFVQKSIKKSKNVLLLTNMYFWRALHILLCSRLSVMM